MRGSSSPGGTIKTLEWSAGEPFEKLFGFQNKLFLERLAAVLDSRLAAFHRGLTAKKRHSPRPACVGEGVPLY